MKRPTLLCGLLTATLVILAAVTWWYFAPTHIGGSTRYVVTSGVSMEPRFHTGDLAIVRPASTYKVGEIVAYHSTLLHVTVLHRIIGRRGDRYVFKGDNNNFIDPVYPTRAELLGKLWLHVPHGGIVLKAFHTPIVAAVICVFLGLGLMAGAEEKRRRHKRRRKGTSGSDRLGIPIVNSPRDHDLARPFKFGTLLTASAAAAAVLLVLGAFAFTRPANKPSAKVTEYSQRAIFGYTAHVTPGPVYPGHVIKTGDPIFLTLVHNLGLHIEYTVAGATPNSVTGTEEVVLKLVGPNGWSRNFVLTPPTHFAGSHTSTDVTLNLPQMQKLLNRVEALTGSSAVGTFSIAVSPRVHITAAVAGHRINTSFAPTLTFQPQSGELVVTSSGGTSGGSSGVGARADYAPIQRGMVSSPTTAPTTVTVLGVSPRIGTLRVIALIGLLLCVPLAAYAFLRRRSEPFEESVQIQSQYGHLIVPIVAGEDLGWPPVDVPSIKSLVRLAESGQRLILHTRSDNIDTYLVNDEGTVYRYQVKPSKVIWGDWSETRVQAAA